MLKKLVKEIGDFYFWSISRKEIYGLLGKYPHGDPQDIMSIIKFYKGDGWYRRLNAFQIEKEFAELIDWAANLKPKVVMEIGTAQGATLLAWCRIATELVISVDLEHGIHGGGYPRQKQRLFKELVFDRDIDLQLFQTSSQEVETRALVEEILGDRKIDLLFIDGDHRLEGVSRDFELWSPLVRENGYVVFHDILPHKTVEDCQVDLLWDQLKDKYNSREIVENYDQGCAGIGILQM